MVKRIAITILPILLLFSGGCSSTSATPVSTDIPVPSLQVIDSSQTPAGRQTPRQTPAPTPTVLTPVPEASPIPDQFIAVRDDIVRTYGFGVDQVVLVSIEEVEWRNSCLGVDEPGMACLDVITPGYLLFFDTPAGKVEVHTNADGSAYRILSNESGIDGQARISPGCPGPARAGSECPDLPYQGSLWVLDENGSLTAEITTDSEGRFRVNLPPGTYTITQPEGTSLPALQPQMVLVYPGQFTQLELELDSGMR